jgi:fatty acid desaturase/membrane-associated phospholipid phosphatase
MDSLIAAHRAADAGQQREAACDRQNWAILAGATLGCAGLLWLAAHASTTLGTVTAALGFAFLANTTFSLLHEAVHGKFDRTPARNAIAGHIAAAFFPTSFTLQTALHLTHHRNNRSAVERFDYIGPDENVPLKTVQWFTILTGLYWLSIPLFWLFYCFFGSLIPWRRLMPSEGRFARQTSAGAFLDSARALPIARIRFELALSIALQVALFWVLGLSWQSWLACYFAFGLMWSSLQYADHAFSVLDQHEGAWNLAVSRFTHAAFLCYHDHLEHHRDVKVRWQDLPRRAADAPKRGWLAMLYLMWRGPRLLPGSGQGEARQKQLAWSVVACHTLVFAAAFQLLYGIGSADFVTRSALYDVSLTIDDYAPFWPMWSLAYVSIGPLLFTAALALHTPERTLPFLATLMLQLVIGVVCFLAFPVEAMPVPAVGMTDLEAALFAMADGINLEGNMMPSLHLAFALSAAWAASPRLSWPPRLAIWGWAGAIVASTWLIRQHWLLDIVGGALLAAAVMGLAYPRLIRTLARLEAAFTPEAARPG